MPYSIRARLVQIPEKSPARFSRAGDRFTKKGKCAYQLAPLLGIHAQKLLVAQVVLVDDRVPEDRFIALEVFFAHLFRVKDVNLCPLACKLHGKRRGEVGRKLVLDAFFCDEA